MAIIAILAGMLLPALNKAREQAKTSQCLNNLKQCGNVFIAYAGDQDGYLPGAAIYKTDGSEGADYWQVALGNLKYMTTFDKNKRTIANCPAEQVVDARSSYGIPDRGTNSRAKTVGVNGDGTMKAVRETDLNSKDLVSADSQRAVLTPTQRQFYVIGNGTGVRTTGSGKSLSLRHRGESTANVLFGDMHVKGISYGWFSENPIYNWSVPSNTF